MSERQSVLLGWQLHNSFGWGSVALNIFCAWARDPDIAPLMAFPILEMAIPSGLDPESVAAIKAAVTRSNQFAGDLVRQGGAARVAMPVVHALGNGFPENLAATGTHNIGRAVFENTNLAPYLPNLDRYDALLCACEWNAQLLRGATGKPVDVIHEAIDGTLFSPTGQKAGALQPGRFYIFSGGKVEYRKAQDLVLLAFREFSRRHDDAVLVTAWQSHWPQISVGFQGRLASPLELNAQGKLNILKWAADSGIAPGKVIDLGQVPNQMVPRILREVDCALQPSRAEAATNLVAMEAMACGVPVVVARNTGMHDLIRDGNCIALERQGAVAPPPGWATDGWGESDVEEIVAALERLYASRELRRTVGAAGHDFMKNRTWPAHAQALKNLVLSRL